MFLYDSAAGECIAVVYVDDSILAGLWHLVESSFHRISQQIEFRDHGEPEAFLGMHILRNQADGTIAVHHAPCVQVLVAKHKPDRL